MVFNPSAGADEALGPFSFFQNNQYSVHLPISCWLFPSNDILTVFPIQMHWSRSSQGHDLYIYCSTISMDASHQVSLKSIYWFQRRRYLKGFYHIWAWRPSWSCALDYLYIHWFPHPIDASQKIWHQLAKRF